MLGYKAHEGTPFALKSRKTSKREKKYHFIHLDKLNLAKAKGCLQPTTVGSTRDRCTHVAYELTQVVFPLNFLHGYISIHGQMIQYLTKNQRLEKKVQILKTGLCIRTLLFRLPLTLVLHCYIGT